jgi:predicted TIM-barrel fold metal-dependent hydrolase
MSRTQWGERMPHIVTQPDGTEGWMVDGVKLPMSGVASAGAAMSDRTHEPQRWSEVPKVAYDPTARLQAMDVDGVDASVLYPTVAGVAGETFGRLTDPELELACVQAYNDWLIEEWASTSPRFSPNALCPSSPLRQRSRDPARRQEGPQRRHLSCHPDAFARRAPCQRAGLHDPLWATCQDLAVPVCFHAGSSTRVQFRRTGSVAGARRGALGPDAPGE